MITHDPDATDARLLQLANDAGLLLLLRSLADCYHTKYKDQHKDCRDRLASGQRPTSAQVSILEFGVAQLIASKQEHPHGGEWRWLYEHLNRWARYWRNQPASVTPA
jgi:hypothetical protein